MSDTKNGESTLDLMLAALGLRIYIGLQLLFAGLDKFMADGKFGGLAAYKSNMHRIGSGISDGSVMPSWMSIPYAMVLPWVLILCGIAILLGIKNRVSFFIAAMTYTSLSIGMALVREGDGVFQLGLYVALCAFALCLNKYNRFTLLKDK